MLETYTQLGAVDILALLRHMISLHTRNVRLSLFFTTISQYCNCSGDVKIVLENAFFLVTSQAKMDQFLQIRVRVFGLERELPHRTLGEGLAYTHSWFVMRCRKHG